MNLSLCCLSCQRYKNLKANHNKKATVQRASYVVYHVKDTKIWKRITTQKLKDFRRQGCLSCQRYKNLKANHNEEWEEYGINVVVYHVKDTKIWKRITTNSIPMNFRCMLFIMSKIQKFESESQHLGTVLLIQQVVYHVKDTKIWKRITTSFVLGLNSHWLFIMSKIQKFESESQPCEGNTSKVFGCLSCQRYKNLKANHNGYSRAVPSISVVYHVKDTKIWKRITTQTWGRYVGVLLFIMSKIQKFESESQRPCPSIGCSLGCLSCQRYKNLKANHNGLQPEQIEEVVVYHVKDTKIWKRITTLFYSFLLKRMLFIMSKIQKFESESQRIRPALQIQVVVYHVKDTKIWKRITTNHTQRRKNL